MDPGEKKINVWAELDPVKRARNLLDNPVSSADDTTGRGMLENFYTLVYFLSSFLNEAPLPPWAFDRASYTDVIMQRIREVEQTLKQISEGEKETLLQGGNLEHYKKTLSRAEEVFDEFIPIFQRVANSVESQHVKGQCFEAMDEMSHVASQLSIIRKTLEASASSQGKPSARGL